MSAATPELRTPVMTMVEASWKDPNGMAQRATARMEDKSRGGACIRIKTPIGVGSKLSIQWRFDQFSGTAKYCRSEGREYLVGIQRDTTKTPIPNHPVPTNVPPQKSVKSGASLLSTVKSESLPKRQESKPNESSAAGPKLETAPAAPIAAFATAIPGSGIGYEAETTERPGIPRREKFAIPRQTVSTSEQGPKKKESGNERKPMGHKWLERAPWHSKQDALSVSGDNGEASREGNSSTGSENENRAPFETQPTEKTPVRAARQVPNFQVELLSVEDIYRSAGIMNPRRGYSINKVVDMLNSEHIRGLSKEMKQGAVLMALDAAGIAVDQVQHDAKSRQDVLDSYEAAQKKQVEAVWARKAEEVVQIQAELESVKAHHLARISRNLEGVAREKATFNSWLTLKQQECENMAAALDLCLKSPVFARAGVPPQAVSNEEEKVTASGKSV